MLTQFLINWSTELLHQIFSLLRPANTTIFSSTNTTSLSRCLVLDVTLASILPPNSLLLSSSILLWSSCIMVLVLWFLSSWHARRLLVSCKSWYWMCAVPILRPLRILSHDCCYSYRLLLLLLLSILSIDHSSSTAISSRMYVRLHCCLLSWLVF